MWNEIKQAFENFFGVQCSTSFKDRIIVVVTVFLVVGLGCAIGHVIKKKINKE